MVDVITRRQSLHIAGVAPFAATLPAAVPEAWTPEWDRAVIRAAVDRLDAAFDPAEALLKRQVGAEYRYHTNMRSRAVHPTRDSLDYALLLLEAGDEPRLRRAARIVDRLLSLQEIDPATQWYGIWGYYLEEPAPKMSPADWNWADFNGALLLQIELRHGKRLPADLRKRVAEGIRHAAASVRRRNVSMTYTNIAIQGTFVTLAAAQLLGDDDLRQYATDRLRRFAARVDVAGSFDEYNSPTYANVSIVNLTRIRMALRDPEILALADRIHTRAWLHLGKHWHVPTRQLAGPMSRSYSTDIGAPLWMQKSLGGRLPFATLADITTGRVTASGETAIHDYRCPESLAPLFLQESEPRQHREVFIPANAPVRPVQGTTWLAPDFCLGSVNRGDFWVQKRPLVAYWGGPGRPARYVQMRFVKDDYDFASALLYSTQEKNYVLGLVNFRTPGGDKHPGLDPVQNGEFRASLLRLCLEIDGAPDATRPEIDGMSAAVNLGGAKLWFQVRASAFGAHKPRLTSYHQDGRLYLALELLRSEAPALVRWRDIPEAYAVFTMAMEGPSGSLTDFHRRCRAFEFSGSLPDGRVSWATPSGVLELSGSVKPAAVADQDRAFSEWRGGVPAPLVRLSDERIISG